MSKVIAKKRLDSGLAAIERENEEKLVNAFKEVVEKLRQGSKDLGKAYKEGPTSRIRVLDKLLPITVEAAEIYSRLPLHAVKKFEDIELMYLLVFLDMYRTINQKVTEDLLETRQRLQERDNFISCL